MNIKKATVLTAVIAVCGFLFAACSASKTVKNEGDFNNDVKGTIWQLSQVKTAGKVTFDHANLKQDEYFRDIYTLQFSEDRVSGKAAPNRYFGPFTLGEKNEISFKHFGSTMMMGIKTPEGLAEHEYFQLMSKVYQWSYSKGQLFLYAKNNNDEKVLLIFNPFEQQQ
ncbi:Heat shock protein [Elusimicrobium minutum Pei191]|uniref:Heat shock protein n=1 Tax=Elusimicrobium minutum (strain Pei191) TaxID=445932 RepID=B2KDF9_ELUMP|nr:META domain-containing protein [Elusimicrobium minutum]ACC98555.1 Heat shock protein [Elusimicrobium minutum Pei191]